MCTLTRQGRTLREAARQTRSLLAVAAAAIVGSVLSATAAPAAAQTTPVPCPGLIADLWFANDESASVNPGQFNLARDAVFRLMDRFDFDASTGLQGAMFGWAGDFVDAPIPALTDTFDDPDDTGFFATGTVTTDGDTQGLRELYTGRGVATTTTSLANAADQLRLRMLDPARSARAGVPQLAIIITDAAAGDIEGFQGGQAFLQSMRELRRDVPNSFAIFIAVSEAADAYSNSPVSTAIIDAAVGDGAVIAAPGYGPLSRETEPYLDELETAICDGGGNPTGNVFTDDLGDAPMSFAEPIHHQVPGSDQYLGAGPPDIDTPPLVSADASGDDTDGTDDEDAVGLLPQLATDLTTYTIPAGDVTASGSGDITAWIDFDRNGVFSEPESTVVTVTNGVLGGDLTWTGLAGLTPGDSYLRLRYTVAGALLDSIATTNLDEGSIAPAPTGEIEDHFLPIVDPAADLLLQKTGPATVTAGGTVDYQFEVRNIGTRTAVAATVTDFLPPGAGVVTIPANCTATSTNFTCTLGDLAPGASTTFAANLRVPGDQVADFTNASAATSSSPDADPTNNDSATTATVDRVVDLELTKTASPTQVTAGETVTWTIEVTNAGPSTATGVVITDDLPAGLTFTASGPASGCSASGQSVSCPIGDLAAGASSSISISTTADATAATTLTNAATATANEPDPDGASASDTVEVVGPPTTAAPPTTVPPTIQPNLPATGATAGVGLWWALAAVVAGCGLVATARRPRRLRK